MSNVDVIRVIMTNIRAGRFEDAIDDMILLDGLEVRDLALKAEFALDHGNSKLALSLMDRCYGR